MARPATRLGSLLAFALLLASTACAGPSAVRTEAVPTDADAHAGDALAFVVGESTQRSFRPTQMPSLCDVQTVEVDDPYYERRKRFRACPLAALLEQGFARPAAWLRARHFFLTARDGYTRAVDGVQLLEDGGWLAFADAEHSVGGEAGAAPFHAGWQPIDRRQVDPGPFYVVWSGTGQQDPHHWPWPYQLVRMEIAPFESRYPHMAPSGADEAAWRGFTTFRRQCVSCHSINGEGGKVGPDLNVPQSIVEYRPVAQIRAYIRNPRRFRYTSMPAHPGLGDGDLDDLVAYFRAMSERKHDLDSHSEEGGSRATP